MPLGTRHTLTGTLRWTRHGYALETEDGGVWRLEMSGSVKPFVDRAVWIEGSRSGFDVLDVQQIWAKDGRRPLSLSDRLATRFNRWRKR